MIQLVMMKTALLASCHAVEIRYGAVKKIRVLPAIQTPEPHPFQAGHHVDARRRVARPAAERLGRPALPPHRRPATPPARSGRPPIRSRDPATANAVTATVGEFLSWCCLQDWVAADDRGRAVAAEVSAVSASGGRCGRSASRVCAARSRWPDASARRITVSRHVVP